MSIVSNGLQLCFAQHTTQLSNNPHTFIIMIEKKHAAKIKNVQ